MEVSRHMPHTEVLGQGTRDRKAQIVTRHSERGQDSSTRNTLSHSTSMNRLPRSGFNETTSQTEPVGNKAERLHGWSRLKVKPNARALQRAAARDTGRKVSWGQAVPV